MNEDRTGLLFALAGFCTLSIGDAIVKSMAEMWPPTAMAATRYVLGAIGLAAILVAKQGHGSLWPMPRAKLQWSRGFAVALASVAMFTALWLMPLAEATTITFTQPMITAVLAAVLLGEKLRFPAILATLLAFAGVMIVLRPNLAMIGPAALLPLVAAFGMALLMIANRASAGAASALAMQAYISVTASVFLLLAVALGHVSGAERFVMNWPEWHVVARCAFIAVTASIGHFLIYMGTVKAGASTIAPMTYGQLLAAVFLGWAFFDEVPDAVAMLGATIIVSAGLWLWYLGRDRAPVVPQR